MRLVRLIWFSAVMLGCSDVGTPLVGPDTGEPRASVDPLAAARDRAEALQRAAEALPRSAAPALFAAEGSRLGVTSRASSDWLQRTLQLVDSTGHIRLPEQFLLNLTNEHAPRVSLNRYRRHGRDYEVWSARVEDPRTVDLDRYDNAVFVVNRHENTLFGTVDVAASIFEIRPTVGGYGVRQSKRFEPQTQCAFERVKRRDRDLEDAASPSRPPVGTRQVTLAEQNDCGTYILDVFFGFTQSAAAEVDDIEAHALMLTETANSGMHNSGIDNVRLRMVEATTTPWEPEGDDFDALDEALGVGEDFLEGEAAASGADFYAMIIGEAAGSGLAYMPGHQSAVGPDTKAWRHEWGHNVGSAHCAPESAVEPYAHGWDAGPGHTTHMCGNEYNIYSTPLLTIDGYKMGDEESADNTRLIRERAEEMATRVDHVVPYEPCEGGSGGAAGSGGAGGGGGAASGGSAGAAGGTVAGTAGTATAGSAGSFGIGGMGGSSLAGGAGSVAGGVSNGASGNSGTRSNPPGNSQGCGCAVPSASSSSAWSYGVLGLATLWARRRRRRIVESRRAAF